MSILPSTNVVMRVGRPEALNSDTLLMPAPEKGTVVNGVLFARRSRLAGANTLSAAKKPPGVIVMPLMWMAVGASSAFFASACSVATVVFSSSLLAFMSATVVLRVAAVALHLRGGVHRFRGLGVCFRCAGICRCGRVARFVDLTIALGELFLQQTKLLLLGLKSLTELLNLGSDRRIRFVRPFGRFGLRWLRSFGGLRIGVLGSIRESDTAREKQRKCECCYFFHFLSLWSKIRKRTDEDAYHPAGEGKGRVLRLRQPNMNIQ